MKNLLKTLIFLLSIFSFISVEAVEFIPSVDNIQIWAWSNSNQNNNKYLDDLLWEWDITVWTKWERSVIELLYTIAKDFKTIVYILSWLAFLIVAIKLLFSEKSEEDVSTFKKAIIWISLWIVVMQSAYSYVNVLYARDFWWALASSFTSNIIKPFIKVLETAVSFFFVLISIYAFYRIITSSWDEDKAKEGKMTIFYALIWFVVVKLSKEIIYAVYWQVDCEMWSTGGIFQYNWSKCIADNDLSWVTEIVVRVINWLNSFVWIIVLLMIIYAWLQVLLSSWDEEKLEKAKNIIKYIVFWLIILVVNFLILTFFIVPEVAI